MKLFKAFVLVALVAAQEEVTTVAPIDQVYDSHVNIIINMQYRTGIQT